MCISGRKLKVLRRTRPDATCITLQNTCKYRKVTRMRTAAIPFHFDKVHSPAAEVPEVVCSVAASVLTAAFNFVQVIYPPPFTYRIISILRHQRETTVAAGLLFLCPHGRDFSRASRAIFVASGSSGCVVSLLIPKEQELCTNLY